MAASTLFDPQARRVAGFNLGVLLSMLSATILPSLTSGQSQQSQELCSSQVCISATIFSKDPNTIEFSLFSKIPVGWLGLGMGGVANGMAGNDLAICWPTSTGKGALISQRSATQNGEPSVLSPTVDFQVQANKSGIASNKDFTCTFLRPLDSVKAPIAATAASVNVIYAVGLQVPSGTDPQKASIQQHAFTGHGALKIQRKDGSSTDANNGAIPPPTKNPNGGSGNNSTGGNNANNGSGEGDLDQLLANQRLYNRLVKAHGILMTIAFLFIFPTGALLVRFFSHLYHVFRWHRPLQVTGFLMIIAAFVCILVAVSKTPDGPPPVTESSHSTLGVILVAALCLQICIGIFIFHTFDPARADRPKLSLKITTWMHRFWGYAVLIAGLIQVNLGMKLYGQWPSGKEGVWYAYDVWLAFLVLTFILGSAVKFWRDRRGLRQQGTEEAGLYRND
ncbi:hypothetical protein EDD11_002626 [Mortierella claussenii]|nr:hypothetical protein EDD11_002626 [Mortierella claussenii]